MKKRKIITDMDMKQAIREGILYFHKIEIELGSFSSYNLENVTFDDCNLFIDFSKANLKNSKFINSVVKICNFKNADLTGAMFEGNNLSNSTFINAKIDGIIFKDNSFNSTKLSFDDFVKLVQKQ